MFDWIWHRIPDTSDCRKRTIVIVASLAIVLALFVCGSWLFSLSITEGLVTEVLGIFLTVLLIDGLRNIDSDISLRESLVRRASSTSNETAKAAIDELRKTNLIDRGVMRKRRLSGANLHDAVLTDIDFTGAELDSANLKNARLNRATLVDIDFTDSEFDQSDFSDADLSGARFVKAKLKNCLFNANRKMKGSRFDDAELNNISFDEADLSDSSFASAKLVDVSFRGAVLQFAVFVRYSSMGEGKNQPFPCIISGESTFERAVLRDAVLDHVVFEKVNFDGADISNGSCVNTRFRSAVLTGVTFYRRNLEDARFDNVQMDGRTRLPDGRQLQEIWNTYDRVELGAHEVEKLFIDYIRGYFTSIGIRGITATISVGKITRDDDGIQEYEDHDVHIAATPAPAMPLSPMVEGAPRQFLPEETY